jgi:hypothetical protein
MSFDFSKMNFTDFHFENPSSSSSNLDEQLDELRFSELVNRITKFATEQKIIRVLVRSIPSDHKGGGLDYEFAYIPCNAKGPIYKFGSSIHAIKLKSEYEFDMDANSSCANMARIKPSKEKYPTLIYIFNNGKSIGSDDYWREYVPTDVYRVWKFRPGIISNEEFVKLAKTYEGSCLTLNYFENMLDSLCAFYHHQKETLSITDIKKMESILITLRSLDCAKSSKLDTYLQERIFQQEQNQLHSKAPADPTIRVG